MNLDDLFKKIGILTVENDLLRSEIRSLVEKINQLGEQSNHKAETEDSAKEN